MLEIMEVIKNRRSVRSYQDKPVPEALVRKIIACACFAPSAMNTQPWRFIVVSHQEAREDLRLRSMIYGWRMVEKIKKNHAERYKIIKERFETMHDPIYYNAPVIIFIVGSGYLHQISCALAAENLMLAAASVGLASCWVALGGAIDKDSESRKLLGLEKDEHIVAPVVLGYEEGTTQTPPRKKTNISWI